MSQRNSGYERKERDFYETPAWVTEALIPELPPLPKKAAWEPAAGKGAITKVLRKYFDRVYGTDIHIDDADHLDDICDFLASNQCYDCAHIITNPPYDQSEEFIRQAVDYWGDRAGPSFTAAFLLRVDYDSAKGRSDLFDHPRFWKKLVLRKRIAWFVNPETGKPDAAPSYNHAWFIWSNWEYGSKPIVSYYGEEEPKPKKTKAKNPPKKKPAKKKAKAG